MINFKKGDKVKWESQSQGHVKTKTGVIVAIVGKRRSPIDICPVQYSSKRIKNLSWRSHRSYLVQVGRYGALYWPRVKHLKRRK